MGASWCFNRRKSDKCNNPERALCAEVNLQVNYKLVSLYLKLGTIVNESYDVAEMWGNCATEYQDAGLESRENFDVAF